MNEEPSRAPSQFPVRRALTLAAGTLLFASACDTTNSGGPDGNVFAPGKPRYGYGSPEQQAAAQRAAAERSAAAANSTKTLDSNKRLREIKRDPNDTTVDISPPESKPDKKSSSSGDGTGSAASTTTTDSTTTTTDSGSTTGSTPSDSGSTTGAAGTTSTTDSTSSKPSDSSSSSSTTDSKPAVTREDLPYGQPVVGKKGYVYSPYAPDKGQVDVDGIPAGTKVKCPYTGKVFRVP